MEIEIRHMEKTTEGTAIIAVIQEPLKPPTPHYTKEDTEEETGNKKQLWKDSWNEYKTKKKEIKLLHLGEAELIQKEIK